MHSSGGTTGGWGSSEKPRHKDRVLLRYPSLLTKHSKPNQNAFLTTGDTNVRLTPQRVPEFTTPISFRATDTKEMSRKLFHEAIDSAKMEFYTAKTGSKNQLTKAVRDAFVIAARESTEIRPRPFLTKHRKERKVPWTVQNKKPLYCHKGLRFLKLMEKRHPTLAKKLRTVIRHNTLQCLGTFILVSQPGTPSI